MKTRTAVLLSTLAIGGLCLTGCTSAPAPAPTKSAAGSSQGLTCSELVAPSVVAALNSELKPDKTSKPEKGSYPARIVSLGGISCVWENPHDHSTLVVSQVKLSPARLASEEARVKAGSTQTIVFGTAPSIRGYEANTGGTYSGDMEVFTQDGYWISALSPLFEEPADAESVIAAALQALPSG